MTNLDWRLVREFMELRLRLQRELERALVTAMPAAARQAPLAPPIDTWEDGDEFVVEAELPGARSEDIELRLDGPRLVLSGSFGAGSAGGGRFLRSERPRGQFYRAVELPDQVGGPPTATLRDGVLQVRLSRGDVRRRVVEIRLEGS